MSDAFDPSAPVVDLPTSGALSTDPADNAPAVPEGTETETPEGVAVPPPPAGKQYPKWEQERIRAMTRVNSDLKRQIDQMQEQVRALAVGQQRQDPAQLGAQPSQPSQAQPNPTPSQQATIFSRADMEARANEIAAQQVQQQSFIHEVQDFAAKGAQQFPDWGQRVAAFEDIGGLNDKGEFVKAVMALPNGADVLYTLGSNLDQANFILNNLSGMQQALALAQISGSLAAVGPQQGQAGNAAPLAASLQISRAPAPTRSVQGRPASSPAGSIYDPKVSMEDYVKLRKAT